MFSARDEITGSATTRVRRRMNIAHSTGIALTMARRSERMRRAKEALLIEPLSCSLNSYILRRREKRAADGRCGMENEAKLGSGGVPSRPNVSQPGKPLCRRRFK